MGDGGEGKGVRTAARIKVHMCVRRVCYLFSYIIAVLSTSINFLILFWLDSTDIHVTYAVVIQIFYIRLYLFMHFYLHTT